MARSRKSAADGCDDALRATLAAPHPDDAAAIADPDRPFAVAFSGGLDSTVLLHATVRVAGPARVLALHVDHGLQPGSADWASHALERCRTLGVRAEVLRARGAPARGDSVEAWARGERYRLLLRAAGEARAAALLTAHHADDQLETLLLRLARGCGLDGLAAMPARDVRDGVVLLRPLLARSRVALEAEARAHGLRWIEDPSNGDPRFARNALRRALPALREALPGLAATLPRTLDAVAQARATLAEVAREDLRACAAGGGVDTGTATSDAGAVAMPVVPPVLSRRALAALPPARRAHALRAWLAGLGAPPPPRARLEQVVAQCVEAGGAHGEVAHAGWRLLRHRDRVFAVPPALARTAPAPVGLAWGGEPELALPAPWGGTLRAVPSPEGPSARRLREAGLRLAPAPSTARLRLRAGGPSRTMKQLWQQAGVPAWLRPRLPALWAGDRLVMAAPFGTTRDVDLRGDDGVVFEWRADDRADPRGWLVPASDAALL